MSWVVSTPYVNTDDYRAYYKKVSKKGLCNGYYEGDSKHIRTTPAFTVD